MKNLQHVIYTQNITWFPWAIAFLWNKDMCGVSHVLMQAYNNAENIL